MITCYSRNISCYYQCWKQFVCANQDNFSGWILWWIAFIKIVFVICQIWSINASLLNKRHLTDHICLNIGVQVDLIWQLLQKGQLWKPFTLLRQYLFSDLQSSFTQWLRLFILPPFSIQHSQVIQSSCHLQTQGKEPNVYRLHMWLRTYQWNTKRKKEQSKL